MDKDNTIGRALLFVPIVAIIGIISMLLQMSGVALPDVHCISADSLGRVYVGKFNGIEVWENGNYLQTISPHTGRGYMFTVTEDDMLLVAASSTVYNMTLEGTILEQWDDPGTNLYNKLQRNKYQCTSTNGDIYELRQSWWWPRIVKNDTEVVFQISSLAFAARIMQYVSIVSLVCIVGYVVFNVLYEKIQDML